MGIIQKQSIKGTLYAYLGVFLGFINTGILFPYIISEEKIGLINTLVAYSAIFAQMATLGFNSVIIKMFTHFRDKTKQHNGFFALIIFALFLGSIAIILSFYGSKSMIIEKNALNSPLLIEYIYFLLPLSVFTLIFLMFDAYYTVLFNAVKGIFLKEFLQRSLIMISVLLYYFEVIDFFQFVIAYTFSLSAPSFVITFSLFMDGEFIVRPQRQFISNELRKTILSVSLFGFIGGFTGIAVLQMDKIMLASMLNLHETGIYTVTFFFGVLVRIPSRAVMKIASPIMADAWKNNDLPTIKNIYQTTSLNLYLVGLLLFVGIWANIDNIFQLLPPSYEAGKYVILFIGFANLIEMTSGVNTSLISTSNYYRVLSYFMFVLLGLVIITNFIFIPIWGISGAAFASLLSLAIYNVLRFLFLYLKLKLHPFNIRFLWTTLLGIFVFLINLWIPVIDNYLLDIAIRSISIAVVYLVAAYAFRLSDELNNFVDTARKTFFR